MPSKRWANAITVFSVKKCRNPQSLPPRMITPRNQPCRRTTGGKFVPGPPGQLSFDDYELETVKEHGDFDDLTKTFTVKTSGLYLLHFSGYYDAIRPSYNYTYDSGASVELMIADPETPFAECINSYAVRSSKLIEYPPVVVSALLPLKAGDKIDAFTNTTRLYQSEDHTYTTRFSGILFSDEFSKRFLPAEEVQAHSKVVGKRLSFILLSCKYRILFYYFFLFIDVADHDTRMLSLLKGNFTHNLLILLFINLNIIPFCYYVT